MTVNDTETGNSEDESERERINADGDHADSFARDDANHNTGTTSLDDK